MRHCNQRQIMAILVILIILISSFISPQLKKVQFEINPLDQIVFIKGVPHINQKWRVSCNTLSSLQFFVIQDVVATNAFYFFSLKRLTILINQKDPKHFFRIRANYLLLMKYLRMNFYREFIFLSGIQLV